MEILIINTYRDFRKDNIVTSIDIENGIEKMVQHEFNAIILSNSLTEEDKSKIIAINKKVNSDTFILSQENEELETSIEKVESIWKNNNRQQLQFSDIFNNADEEQRSRLN